jgi:FixJ family two-component response regulator
VTPSSSPGRIVIVDDDPEIRGSLDSLMRSSGFAVSSYASTAEFVSAGRPDEPSCLVLDVRLPGENGLDFLERLADLGLSIPVVLMTGHGDIPMTVRGMRAGAVDFLPKPFTDDEMLEAVATAIGRDREALTVAAVSARLQELYDDLTGRERDVMGLVVAGLMNKQVASRLSLSEITVKIHRGNVMRKMEAQSLADLVRMAEQLGIRDESIRRFPASARSEPERSGH